MKKVKLTFAFVAGLGLVSFGQTEVKKAEAPSTTQQNQLMNTATTGKTEEGTKTTTTTADPATGNPIKRANQVITTTPNQSLKTTNPELEKVAPKQNLQPTKGKTEEKDPR